MYQPKLYVFEGGDACGKATQSAMLARLLQSRVVAFPTYEKSPIGKVILDMLHMSPEARATLTGLFGNADKPFERLLQAAMTWDRYSCPDLTGPDKALVLDRYFVSGCVFGALDGLNLAELIRAHTGLPAPTVCFLLDLPVEEQMARLAKRGRTPDIYENPIGLQERLTKIRESYLAFFKMHGPATWPDTSWVILDGTRTQDEIAAQVQHHLQLRYSSRVL
jgi:thymidylate kinase